MNRSARVLAVLPFVMLGAEGESWASDAGADAAAPCAPVVAPPPSSLIPAGTPAVAYFAYPSCPVSNVQLLDSLDQVVPTTIKEDVGYPIDLYCTGSGSSLTCPVSYLVIPTTPLTQVSYELQYEYQPGPGAPPVLEWLPIFVGNA